LALALPNAQSSGLPASVGAAAPASPAFETGNGGASVLQAPPLQTWKGETSLQSLSRRHSTSQRSTAPSSPHADSADRAQRAPEKFEQLAWSSQVTVQMPHRQLKPSPQVSSSGEHDLRK
jgi:hypothetical protein